jgi:hypothetical protein
MIRPLMLASCFAAAATIAAAQGGVTAPDKIAAGAAFSIGTSGSGQGTLYIVGPEQVIKRSVQLGSSVPVEPGTLYSAGHYSIFVSGGGTAELDVLPADKPAEISFLARPSRLPVGVRDGVTGAAYIFDSYRNLVVAPTPISFQLALPNGSSQSRTATAKNGAAWIAMDSSAKEGRAHFIAKAGDVTATRIIAEVPGDPCTLRMSAKPSGSQKISLETEPVKDCSGNAVPDGTVVTFTETFNGTTSTVDVPLKRGVAKVEMPAYSGANISVASGVMLGNQIRWGR